MDSEASKRVFELGRVYSRARSKTLLRAWLIKSITFASATALLARPGFVDGQRPALVGCAVQGRDGLLGLFVVTHFHEAESPGSAGLAVCDDLSLRPLAMLLEQGQQLVGRHVPGEVADMNVLRHDPQTFPRTNGRSPRSMRSGHSPVGSPARPGPSYPPSL